MQCPAGKHTAGSSPDVKARRPHCAHEHWFGTTSRHVCFAHTVTETTARTRARTAGACAGTGRRLPDGSGRHVIAIRRRVHARRRRRAPRRRRNRRGAAARAPARGGGRAAQRRGGGGEASFACGAAARGGGRGRGAQRLTARGAVDAQARAGGGGRRVGGGEGRARGALPVLFCARCVDRRVRRRGGVDRYNSLPLPAAGARGAHERDAHAAARLAVPGAPRLRGLKPNLRARRPRFFVACCSGRAISLARAVGRLCTI